MFYHHNVRVFACLLHLSGGLVSLALAAIGWYIVEGPMAQRRTQLAREAAECLELTRSAGAFRQRRTQLQDEIARLDVRLREAQSQAAVTHSSRLFEQFAELARETQASLHDYRPGQAQAVGTYREHRLQLHLSGSYDALCRFLVGLENLPLLGHVAHVKITTHGSAAGTLNLELSLHCYAAVQMATTL